MMKNIKIIALLFVLAFTISCEDYLKEDPKALLTAQYLETEAGVNSALYSAYSDLRYIYGGESAMNATCSGTDEWEKGPDGSANFNLYQSGMSADNSISGLWNWGYTAINTANAVIKYAPVCGMTEEEAARAIAEAKYLRATWYFILVQTWGACPLNLEFISVPSTEAYRTPVAEVYAAIIADLEVAKTILPPAADEPGRATAAAAYHLLAKVYLARATTTGANSANDYQQAYNNAMELISNKGTYGLELLQDFETVFAPRNEHNSEVIFTAERNTDILYNNAGNPSGAGSNSKNNIASMFYCPNYSAWGIGGLVRDIPYGRPWHRIRPTNYLLDVTFAERTDDTRYNKTFRTVWLLNEAAGITAPGYVLGDTAAWLPGVENPRAAKAVKIFKPSQYYNNNGQTMSVYPAMRKYYDIDRPEVAESSVRPFIIYRFAETYLIAAEAAMYLDRPADAVDMINVVRDRASYNASRSAAENALALQRMRNKVPDMTDKGDGIDFILDERSRELCGEYMRWWDLVRTKTGSGEIQLLYRVRNLISPVVYSNDGHIPAYSNIQDYHLLRPIPQSQIDLTSNEFLQNPGY
ncbi:MAG TPA: RagB/SusD family nutrient uptake outer membrane protein [Bacteroidales bacterium]|nr:RagB/SusD family nutrient uptake outer membrane protein [Bacteroidales bacterium]